MKLNHTNLIHNDENSTNNVFGQNKYINDNKYWPTIILCLKKDINKLETVIERIKLHLQLQRHDIAKILTRLTSALAFGSKLRLLLQEKQGVINFFNKIELLENRANKNENRLLCNYKHSPCFKEDLKDTTTSQDTVTQQLPHPSNETRTITEPMTADDDLKGTLIPASKVSHNELIQLHQSKNC